MLRFYGDFTKQSPEELNGTFFFLTVPPGPPFPENLWGKKMYGVVWCYAGPPDQAEKVLAPTRKVGALALYGVQAMPYPVIQSAFDPLLRPGLQYYSRADFVKELSDEVIARHSEWAYCEARWAEVIVGIDPDPANAKLIRDWTVAYWEAVHPYSMGGAYVNFMMDEGQDRVRASYREK